MPTVSKIECKKKKNTAVPFQVAVFKFWKPSRCILSVHPFACNCSNVFTSSDPNICLSNYNSSLLNFFFVIHPGYIVCHLNILATFVVDFTVHLSRKIILRNYFKHNAFRPFSRILLFSIEFVLKVEVMSWTF